MEIKLNKLTFLNFKGLRNFELILNGKNVNVYAKNKKGKTTLFDGFLWVLFNKNSEDKTDFEIKTLDENNIAIPKLSHEVSCEFLIDNIETQLKKTYKEVQTKPTGKEYKILKSHTTDYEINDLDKSPKDYKFEISSIIDENLFRLITSPKYFQSLGWKKKREILFKLVPSVNDNEILDKIVTSQNKDYYTGLIGILNQGKKASEFLDKIKSQIKKLNESLEEIPIIIKEKKRDMSKIEISNFEEINKEILKLNNEKEVINNQIQDKTDAHQKIIDLKLKKQTELFNLKTELKKLENERANNQDNSSLETENKISKLEKEITSFREEINEIQDSIKKNNIKIANFESQVDELKSEFMDLNEKEPDFDNLETECPLFKFPLSECSHSAKFLQENREEIEANFNINLKNRKDEINIEGVEIVEKIGKLQNDNSEFEDKKSELNILIGLRKTSINELKSSLEKPKETTSIPQNEIDLKEQIETIENDISFVKPIDNAELIKSRDVIQNQIDELNKKSGVKETVDNNKSRITELEEKEKAISIEIANLEKQEFAVENFDKAKIEATEDPINAKFKYVKFKMYKKLINGGSEPCCITLIDGVPYESANNAAKINSGLDIINTLCDFHDVYAPIFSDNSESINDLLETKSQMIRLFVVDDNWFALRLFGKLYENHDIDYNNPDELINLDLTKYCDNTEKSKVDIESKKLNVEII